MLKSDQGQVMRSEVEQGAVSVFCGVLAGEGCPGPVFLGIGVAEPCPSDYGISGRASGLCCPVWTSSGLPWILPVCGLGGLVP